MSILILNRNAPYPFQSWLKDVEEDLIILTTKNREKAINYASYVEGFDNYEGNGCIEIKAAELFESHHYHTLIATSEFDIYRAAKIREHVGIKGQGVQSALAFRDKVVMKRILSKNGLEVPAFIEVDTAIDLYDFVKKQGYPVVVKPRDGSGSEGVRIIEKYEDLIEFVEKNTLINYEVEEFIKGDMYHVDGIVLNNKIAFSWPSKYINGCLSHLNGEFNGSYLLGEFNPLTLRLQNLVESILNVLPTPRDTSFHAEFFHTSDDRLVFCEIACRRGGGYISETIEHAFSINLTMSTIQSQCGMVVNLPIIKQPKTMCGFLLIPAKKGTLEKIPKHFDESWIIKHEINACVGDVLNGSGSSLDNIASFLIEGHSEIQVQERIKTIASYFEHNTVWKNS